MKEYESMNQVTASRINEIMDVKRQLQTKFSQVKTCFL
jgi:hypothetical protein